MNASIGRAFRQARDRHGLSVDAVAYELDLEPRHVTAMEDDVLEQEVGAATARAHVKLYALFLGLDAKSLLAGLPVGTPRASSPATQLAERTHGAASSRDGAAGGGGAADREAADREAADRGAADDAAWSRGGAAAGAADRTEAADRAGTGWEPFRAAGEDTDAAPGSAVSEDEAGATAARSLSDAGAAGSSAGGRAGGGAVAAGAGAGGSERSPAAETIRTSRATDRDADAATRRLDSGELSDDPDEPDIIRTGRAAAQADTTRRLDRTRPIREADAEADEPWQPPPLIPTDAPPTGEGFFADVDDDEDLYEDEDDAHRRRRAVGIVGGLLLAGLLVGFLFSVIGGGDDLELADSGTADTTDTTDTTDEEPADVTAEDPAAVPEELDPAVAGPAGAAETSIQVLDGVGDRVAYQQAIAYLESLGYTVEPSGGSAREYAQTTLFFSEGNNEQAEALASSDPARFSVVAPNDRGLSEDIDLHVVVGADWPTDDGAAAEEPAADDADG